MAMETKRAKRIFLGLCMAAFVSFVSTGCGGKKDNPNPDFPTITMKVTVTASGVNAEDDQLDIQIGAGNHDASQYGAPVWKINNVTQGNEDAIIYDAQKWAGGTKTYVFETVKPYNFGYLFVNYSNRIPEGGPITLSYKVEINGKVETNVQNLVVAPGVSDRKEYQYGKR
jgi:hypothetical protein